VAKCERVQNGIALKKEDKPLKKLVLQEAAAECILRHSTMFYKLHAF
jgi:hypothetical protein